MRRPSTTTRRSRWTLGVQHAVVASHPLPLTGGLITMAGRRSIVTSGPSITGGSTNTAVDVPAGTRYSSLCVTRSGAVPGDTVRSTWTAAAADAGISDN